MLLLSALYSEYSVSFMSLISPFLELSPPVVGYKNEQEPPQGRAEVWVYFGFNYLLVLEVGRGPQIKCTC